MGAPFDESLNSTLATGNPVSATPVSLIAADSAARFEIHTIDLGNIHTAVAEVTITDGVTSITVGLGIGAGRVIKPSGWKTARNAALTAQLGATGDVHVNVEYSKATG